MTTIPSRPREAPAIIATVLGDRTRRLPLLLLIAGAALMLVGIMVICIGWYGMAHSAYPYDELVYLMSGGILGLGITIVGATLFVAGSIARAPS